MPPKKKLRTTTTREAATTPRRKSSRKAAATTPRRKSSRTPKSKATPAPRTPKIPKTPKTPKAKVKVKAKAVQSTPKSASRTLRSDPKSVSPPKERPLFGKKSTRSTIEHLDTECESIYGVGHRFVGKGCTDNVEKFQKERKALVEALQEATGLSGVIRGKLDVIRVTFVSMTSVMSERVARETGTKSTELNRQHRTFENYTQAVMRLSGGLLLRMEYCNGTNGTRKLEEGCFDSAHVSNMNTLAHEVIDLLASYHTSLAVFKDKFSRTVGERLLWVGAKVSAAVRGTVTGGIQLVKMVARLAWQNARSIAIMLALQVALPLALGTYLKNAGSVAQAVNSTCRVVEIATVLINNPWVLGGLGTFATTIVEVFPITGTLMEKLKGLIVRMDVGTVPEGVDIVDEVDKVHEQKVSALMLTTTGDAPTKAEIQQTLMAAKDEVRASLAAHGNKKKMSVASVDNITTLCIVSYLSATGMIIKPLTWLLSTVSSSMCGAVQEATNRFQAAHRYLTTSFGGKVNLSFLDGGILTKYMKMFISKADNEEVLLKMAQDAWHQQSQLILSNAPTAVDQTTYFTKTTNLLYNTVQVACGNPIDISNGSIEEMSVDNQMKFIQNKIEELKVVQQKDSIAFWRAIKWVVIALALICLMVYVVAMVMVREANNLDTFMEGMRQDDLSHTTAIKAFGQEVKVLRAHLTKVRKCMASEFEECDI